MIIFLVSLIHTIFIGLIDALIKGNVIVYHNGWRNIPWYFKDQYYVYPGFIALLFVISGVFIARRLKINTLKYIIILGLWGLSGLESLSYWFWIMVFNIGQTMHWLPDSSMIWWYPKEAPWLNVFPHLKAISVGNNVTRGGVLIGSIITIGINLVLCLYIDKNKLPNS